jgi:ribosomal protein S12 methylthiotransferase
MQTQLTVSEEHNAESIGKTLTVLCDGYDRIAEIYYGRSYADAPDVDGKVYFKSTKPVNSGEFVSVKITEALDYDLIGELTV